MIKSATCNGWTDTHSVAMVSLMEVSGEVIAANPPLLTTHTFPPVALDYEIIKPKRVGGSGLR